MALVAQAAAATNGRDARHVFDSRRGGRNYSAAVA